ncbi:MAG TPA: MEMAR_RS02690 family S-layer glycoprotein [Methanocorpusculum sp.]|nr:MEMAR_RS02690 family S-layer glycoprotein [Methanocorpusculum sp.]
MAVLVVLLAAMLFVGAASAAITQGTQDVTLTAPETGVVGVPVTITLTNATAHTDVKGTYTLNYTNTTAPSTPNWDNLNEYVKTFPELTAGKSVSLTWTPGAPGTYVFGAFNLTDPEKYNDTCTITVTLPDGVREVASGDDVFVYEHIFYEGATRLVKYSDGATPSVINQISGASGIFYLTEDVVDGQYGTYNVTGEAGNLGTVSIWYPEISLQAELTNSPGDSIDGKSINKNTAVTFLINSPKVQPAFEDEKDKATAKIVFTTPSNGKTTYFGDGDNIDNRELTSTQTAIKAGSIGNVEAGPWTAQAEYTLEPFATYAAKSNTVKFTVQSTTLTITAGKDSVVRSNPFTVAIQGNSKALYFVYLDGASKSDTNPELMKGQSGMKTTIDSTLIPENHDIPDHADLTGTYGFFETDASGTRTIQYDTTASTTDKTYTVKVYEIAEKWDWNTEGPSTYNVTSNYDSVKVKVEKGAVTISAAGDGVYYIGQEIELTGTNTDSDYVYLFITGPNLASDGVILKKVGERLNLGAAAEARNAAESDSVSVETDYTWEYKWDTSKCYLNTGSYTIYATSSLTNGKSSSESEGTYGKAVKLSDSEYATVSVSLKQPFLSAVPSGTVVAKGDDIYIRGTAEGDPSKLQLYIFGPNKFVYESITVEDDGTYEKKLNVGSDWASSQYYVVIEHPMYNGDIDVHYDKSTGEIYINNTAGLEGTQSSFNVNEQQSSNAADALTKMIDNPNIDDVYTKLTFTVVPAMITINNPGDQAAGSKFTITGTTNLAVDDQIIVDVLSSSFTAVDKSSTSITDGVSVTTKVVAGDGTDNVWSVEVDTTNWKLDEYTIRAEGIEVDVSATTNFNLVEKVVTPTATATGATPTTTATATATATATPATPGFGAFIALAGLGAVALLVLRRN